MMSGIKALSGFLVIALCVTYIDARPPPKPDHERESFRRFVCEVRNATANDELVMNRKCGCDGEVSSCGWGNGLSVTGPLGETLNLKFCTPVNESPLGVLVAACSVNGEVTERDCGTLRDGTEIECSVGPLDVTVNGTDISAKFCAFPHQQNKPEGSGKSDDSSDSDEAEDADCVPLSRPVRRDNDSSSHDDKPRTPKPAKEEKGKPQPPKPAKEEKDKPQPPKPAKEEKGKPQPPTPATEAKGKSHPPTPSKGKSQPHKPAKR